MDATMMYFDYPDTDMTKPGRPRRPPRNPAIGGTGNRPAWKGLPPSKRGAA